VTASYGQYSAHGVSKGTTEYATRAGICQISAIRSKRALFPYNDSCHVNYSAHKLSVPKVNFPALVATLIVAVPSYSRSQGMHTQYHHMKPCQYVYTII